MNHRIASAITFTGTVAFATIAAAFLSSNAYADDPTIDTTVFVSTKSRAEVRAEVMSQRDQITASRRRMGGAAKRAASLSRAPTRPSRSGPNTRPRAMKYA